MATAHTKAGLCGNGCLNTCRRHLPVVNPGVVHDTWSRQASARKLSATSVVVVDLGFYSSVMDDDFTSVTGIGPSQ